MSIEIEWYNESALRKDTWEREGISIREAEQCLEMFLFPVNNNPSPVAKEMAEYVISNWTAKRFARLSKKYREIALLLWDEQFGQSCDEYGKRD